ncbi:MAG: homoserine kinase [Turicibacter sp.]|nr:homoserine kinase [Turicibacter sp.]
MKIRVPATSANVGCGFDSLGFAVNLYLEVEVLAEADAWEVIHDLGPDIPSDASNLIVSTALKIVPDLKPQVLRVTNEVPVERGLGSSSTALVAGIELAYRLGGMSLTLDEKLQIACEAEGHPDNVAPAILGGFVAAFYHEGTLSYVKLDLAEVGLVAFVPDRKMSTQAMRQVLPAELPYGEAVRASAIANTMIAHLASGNYTEAGKLIESDRLHEPYRAQLLPELAEVRVLARGFGAYATYLSGAGSTIMTMLPVDRVAALVTELNKMDDATVLPLRMVLEGAHG